MEKQQQNDTTFPPVTKPFIISPFKFSTIILLTLVGMAIATVSVSIGIRIGRNQNTNSQPVAVQPTPTPVTSQSVTWKTYSDLKNNISFKYPSNASVSTEGINVLVAVEFDGNPCSIGGASGCYWFVRIYGPDQDPAHRPVDQWMKSTFSDSNKYAMTYTKIAGMDAVGLKHVSEEESPSISYFVQRANDIVTVEVGVFGKLSDYQMIVDKLLSTILLE